MLWRIPLSYERWLDEGENEPWRKISLRFVVVASFRWSCGNGSFPLQDQPVLHECPRGMKSCCLTRHGDKQNLRTYYNERGGVGARS